MPELPEVETVVRDLRPVLVNRRIVAISVGPQLLRRPWQPEWEAKLLGDRVTAIRRRAKWIIVDLESARRLLVHLGMTGQLTVTSAGCPVLAHTHVIFDLDGRAEQLRFRDVRRFGSVELIGDETALQAFLAERVGPEPESLDPQGFALAICRSERPVKAILLDQHVAAGVGNIYADEALYHAGVHPQRRGRTLTGEEVERLRLAIATVIRQAIDNRGSTIRDYIGGSGLRGQFQNQFYVYGRTDQACRRCGSPISSVRVGGRASHFCPLCQPVHPRRKQRQRKVPSTTRANLCSDLSQGSTRF